MSKKDTLPRESSRDFTDEEMKDIEPAIDIELGPGDVLYMPRGWIHQANTCKNDNHSLHLTVSAMQSWSWVDLLEIIMPNALEAASTSSLSLRAGLPRKFLSFMGTMHDVEESRSDILNKLKEKNDEDDDEVDAEQVRRKIQQESFTAEAKKKILRVCKEALSMVTYGCDEIGIRMLSDRLPPALTEIEAALTSESRAESGGKIFPNTLVRLAKPGLARLVVEGGKVVVYHSLDNSRVYHETPLSPLEFEIDDAPALEMVLTTIEPHWICVQDLIHGDIEDKMDICQSLYDEGILAMFQNDRPDKSVQTG
jgi:lysine-specific demethylase/histidyl-hydroxylase NO66